MINQYIQEFKILSLLGEGGMAKVYLAHDTKFDTNVAVKLLNVEYAHNENIRKRFLAEAKSMFRMSHPNIIKVTDLIDEQDTVAFVMEFVEGETLKEFIDRKRKLTDEEIVSVFSQMLDAVGYVHSQKLVHRDIKPSNFMVTPTGSVKLMDFGIAKNTDETSMEYTQTGTGMQMGTPMYMSPEQVRNTSEVTQSSDIYSLGIVLWQMVTGTKPYDTKTLSSFDLQTKIVTENLPRTNTRWDVIIEKATSKAMEQRFSDCVSFRKVIKEYEFIQEDTIEHTIIEQSKPIEKELHKDKQNEVVNTVQKEVLTYQKRKWILPTFVGVLLLLGSLYYLNAVYSDGNKNTSVVIGNQEWMTENLNVTTFRNGDPILHAVTQEEWIKAGKRGEPAWCYYNNNSEKEKKYGKLYNWYAVKDTRGIAPYGWHVPSDQEWSVLIDYLGGEEVAGKKMKSSEVWTVKMNGANSSGFTALPGGFRSDLGRYGGIGNSSYWWSSSEDDFIINTVRIRFLFSNEVGVNSINSEMNSGYYIRCLRN